VASHNVRLAIEIQAATNYLAEKQSIISFLVCLGNILIAKCGFFLYQQIYGSAKAG